MPAAGIAGRAAALTVHLRETIAGLIGDLDTPRFGVAVSGGPDSMALLHLTAQAFPARVAAVTVDHGLRAASADEAAMVAHWCAGRAIPHAILHPDAAVTGNVQAWAREQRYALIDRWRQAEQIDWVLTAHHADDQLETLLMRLNRGAGVGGLAGVRARSGHVLRPLLAVRKADLIAHAQDAAIPTVDDPSNSDPRFDRASLRARLANIDWIDRPAAARSAAALAEAEEALDWTAGQLAQRHVRADGQGGWTLDPADLPRELLRRLVLLMLSQAGAPAPRGPTLDQAIETARSGGQSSLGDWLLRGGQSWRLRRAPDRRA